MLNHIPRSPHLPPDTVRAACGRTEGEKGRRRLVRTSLGGSFIVIHHPQKTQRPTTHPQLSKSVRHHPAKQLVITARTEDEGASSTHTIPPMTLIPSSSSSPTRAAFIILILYLLTSPPLTNRTVNRQTSQPPTHPCPTPPH